MAESAFIEHAPCEACGSSDAGALYEDGSFKCHKCGHKKNGDGVRMSPDDRGQSSRGDRTRTAPPSDLLDVQYMDLQTRRLPKNTCVFWGYGVASHRGEKVQVAQYYDNSRRLVAQKCRTQGKKFYWLGDRSRCGLYGEWLWRDGGKKLVITEGEIDALSVSSIQGDRWPVASLPDGAGSAEKAVANSLSWVESFDEVVLMFDQDEPGMQAAEKVARMLTPGKCKISTFGAKDANELLVAGRADRLKEAIWGGKVWKPQGILQGEDLWKAMGQRRHPPLASYPFPELQDKTLGLHGAEIVLLCSGVGGGKSTLTYSMVNSLLDQGLKVGILPLEEIGAEAATKLIGMRVGRNFGLEPGADITQEEVVREAFDQIQEQLVIFDDDGRRDAQAVFDRLRYMAVGLKLPVIVVDHLTVVIGAASGDDRRYAEQVMSELESLVKRTGVAVIVVMHLKKPGEGRGHEEGRRVQLSDIRGSGLIAALSHKVFAYERDQQNEDGPSIGTFRVLKNRPLGRTGPAGQVVYEEKTGRLVPYLGEPVETDF